MSMWKNHSKYDQAFQCLMCVEAAPCPSQDLTVIVELLTSCLQLLCTMEPWSWSFVWRSTHSVHVNQCFLKLFFYFLSWKGLVPFNLLLSCLTSVKPSLSTWYWFCRLFTASFTEASSTFCVSCWEAGISCTGSVLGAVMVSLLFLVMTAVVWLTVLFCLFLGHWLTQWMSWPYMVQGVCRPGSVTSRHRTLPPISVSFRFTWHSIRFLAGTERCTCLLPMTDFETLLASHHQCCPWWFDIFLPPWYLGCNEEFLLSSPLRGGRRQWSVLGYCSESGNPLVGCSV